MFYISKLPQCRLLVFNDPQTDEGRSMIAGVVATLAEVDGNLPDILVEMAALPGVEIGAVEDGLRRIPITIDSPDPVTLENTTQRLQGCRGVAFVDVVCVHFEHESERAVRPLSERTPQI